LSDDREIVRLYPADAYRAVSSDDTMTYLTRAAGFTDRLAWPGGPATTGPLP